MKLKTRSYHVPSELLVRLRNSQSAEPGQADSVQSVGKVVARYPLGGQSLASESFSPQEILHLKLEPGQSLEAAIQRLEADPGVAYAVTNDIIEAFQDPQETRPDDLHPELYGMEKISAPRAWTQQVGSRQQGPLVGIIDSGTDYTHPDLVNNIWTNPNEVANGIDDDGNGVVDDLHGYDAAGKDGDPMDDGSHGTHVAGTVAAEGNNGQGVVGVAWQARLMPLKFLAGGYGSMADAIAALTYADSQGVRLTQNSWGGPNPNQALVDTMKASPALHICAAGNSSNDSDVKPLFPAAYPLDNILSVAATDQNDQLASFSNYGRQSVDLAAPGVGIYSTIPGADFGHKSGTSMATPHVSGAASVVLTEFPDLTNQQLKDRLMFSTDRLPQLEGVVGSGGRLNLAQALEHDETAPGSVGDFQGEAASPSQVRLSWLASGDDAQSGRAAGYELAYSDKPFGEDAFGRQHQVPLGPPKESGQREQAGFELTPSARERELYVGLRAVDNVGNRSPLSVTRVKVPAAYVAFEDGPENWTAEGQWGREVVPGRGPVWSDSPGEFYRRDQDASLTSKSFSLRDFSSATLQFECRHDLEINFDKVHLEVRSEEGEWKGLKAYNLLAGWEKQTFDLAEFAGQDQVQLRFRLKTDGDVHKEGFQFDRLVITGEPSSTAPSPR